jgi:hypothetical protein
VLPSSALLQPIFERDPATGGQDAIRHRSVEPDLRRLHAMDEQHATNAWRSGNIDGGATTLGLADKTIDRGGSDRVQNMDSGKVDDIGLWMLIDA